MKHHKKKSKRLKLSTKYNLQKKVREHRRRLRKEAKKLGLDKGGRKRKDPGIPNNWPFKAEMLADIERKRELKEKDLLERRQRAKKEIVKTKQQREAESRRAHEERQEARRARREQQDAEAVRDALRRALGEAETVVEVLDARDPEGCRCPSLEAWAVKNSKRLVFAITKADLVPREAAAGWLEALSREGPAAVVQGEGTREGVAHLLEMLGRAPAAKGAKRKANTSDAATDGGAICVAGYPATGKQTLLRAMRREAKTPGVKWLVEAPARLQPPKGPLGVERAVHLALRAAMPSGNDSCSEPVEAVKLLLARAQLAAVMRKFRLPAFEGVEAFLDAFGKDRDLKSKKGTPASQPQIAKSALQELAAPPGGYCAPPSSVGASEGASNLWAAYGEERSRLEAVCQKQLASLRGSAAESGEAAAVAAAGSALALAAGGGVGPPVEIEALLATAEGDGGSDEDDDMASTDGELGLGEEGGESELDCEGSEEESMEEEDD